MVIVPRFHVIIGEADVWLFCTGNAARRHLVVPRRLGFTVALGVLGVVGQIDDLFHIDCTAVANYDSVAVKSVVKGTPSWKFTAWCLQECLASNYCQVLTIRVVPSDLPLGSFGVVCHRGVGTVAYYGP